MVVELGFLSVCTVSLCYQGHLVGCATRSEEPYSSLACHYHQAYGGPCSPTLIPGVEAGVRCGQGQPCSDPLPRRPRSPEAWDRMGCGQGGWVGIREVGDRF